MYAYLLRRAYHFIISVHFKVHLRICICDMIHASEANISKESINHLYLIQKEK